MNADNLPIKQSSLTSANFHLFTKPLRARNEKLPSRAHETQFRYAHQTRVLHFLKSISGYAALRVFASLHIRNQMRARARALSCRRPVCVYTNIVPRARGQPHDRKRDTYIIRGLCGRIMFALVLRIVQKKFRVIVVSNAKRG